MAYYIVKLAVMLPLIAGLIVASLWLYRRVQPSHAASQPRNRLCLVDSLSLGTAGRLAVVEFGDQRLLLSAVRGRIECLASQPNTPDAAAALPEPGAAAENTAIQAGAAAADVPAAAPRFSALLARTLQSVDAARRTQRWSQR